MRKPFPQLQIALLAELAVNKGAIEILSKGIKHNRLKFDEKTSNTAFIDSRG